MTPTLRQIRAAVAEYYEITEADLTGPSRRAVFAHPRMLAYKISREVNGAGVSEIARFYRKDHTSIGSGIQSIINRQAHQAKIGRTDLKADEAAIIKKAESLAIVENGGVFCSQRGETPLFISTRSTKETQ